MFHFENIGFSHTKDGVKYLTCAMCEKEVLGVQFLEEEGKPMFVACARLKYR
jgi:hypothetical protein